MKNRIPPDKAPAEIYDPLLCPVRNVIAKIGGKWCLLIITH